MSLIGDVYDLLPRDPAPRVDGDSPTELRARLDAALGALAEQTVRAAIAPYGFDYDRPETWQDQLNMPWLLDVAACEWWLQITAPEGVAVERWRDISQRQER